MDKKVGNLLYHMATRFKGSEERAAMLLEYVCDLRISSGEQLSGEGREGRREGMRGGGGRERGEGGMGGDFFN